jgi:hemolysin-activating ACP:hemolysin acyltransferase
MTEPNEQDTGSARVGARAEGRALPEGIDQAQMGAALSKLISASIGDLAMVMARSPGHKHHSLADIEWMVLPAVLSGQFYVAEAASKERGFRAPIACVTWASVSDEVDRHLRADAARKIRLRPDEWTSGEHVWLVDMAGDARALSGALKGLLETRFKDKVVNVATRSADGATRVETLAELAAAAQEAAA